MQVLALGVTVVAWAAVHSVLASNGSKAFVQRAFGPEIARGYRLAYNVFSAISLLPVAWLMWKTPDRLAYAIPVPWSMLMLGVQGLAAILAALALLQTNVLHFAGLSQILGRSGTGGLASTGFYGFVRHPLYLFGLVFLWFSSRMTVNQLVVTLVFSAYLFVGPLFEEKRLEQEFGSAYRDYRAKTPMIFPRIARPRAE